MERMVDTATTGMPRHPGTSSCGRCVFGCDADWHEKGGRGPEEIIATVRAESGEETVQLCETKWL